MADQIANGESGLSVRTKLNTLLTQAETNANAADTALGYGKPISFASRAELVTWVASNTPINGREYRAAGLSYLGETGASLAGMPAGLVPSGVLSTDHFDTVADALIWIASVGGEMVLPSRRITLTSGLTLPKLGAGGKRVILRGSGPASDLYFIAGTGNFIYAGDPITAGGAQGWELRDFKITGTGTASGTGIYLENANSVRIHNITFEDMLDGIGTSDTFALRVTNCHVISLGGDFIRCDTRIFHLVVDKNNAFNIGGYFVNFLDVAAQALNVRITNNDVEVCGGVVKSTVGIAGLAYQGNYMEQPSGKIFDFGAAVYGAIDGGNTFQLSGAQTIDNFHGRFTGNHLFEVQFTWASTSFPCAVGNNGFGVNGSVAAMPAKTPAIGAAYMVQSAFQPPTYRKDDTGRVYLNGNATRDTGVAAPTFPYLLFTLDAGYRPAAPQTFITQGTTTGSAKIRITIAGDVFIDANSASDLGLGGINFMAV